MAVDTLAYGRGTRGSHTVLMHGRRLRTRASISLPRYSSYASSTPWRDDVESFAPIQSAGESPVSVSIENYLGSAIAEYDDLVSIAPKQIRLTASPATRTAAMDPWKAKNRRRIRLIEKRHKGRLNERETAELATLESQFSAHLQEVAPRSREVLDEFSDYVARMKAKVASKKRVKP